MEGIQLLPTGAEGEAKRQLCFQVLTSFVSTCCAFSVRSGA